jgi:hypothetical protein
MTRIIAAISIAFITAATSLADGIEAEFEMKNLEKGEAPLIQKFRIAGDRIAMQTGSGGTTGNVIFRGDKSLVWIVDNQNRQYIEMTRETMEKIGRTMSSVMDQVKARMASMPPEQRAMMEKMMADQMGQASGGSGGALDAVPPLSFKKTGIQKTINGYSCEKYDVFRGQEKLRELWITEWKNMKDFSEAMTAFNSMGKFFSTMMESLKDNPFVKTMDTPYSHTAELNGFPVMSTEVKNGVPVMVTTLKKVTRMALPESDFVPPADYKANTSIFKQSSK